MHGFKVRAGKGHPNTHSPLKAGERSNMPVYDPPMSPPLAAVGTDPVNLDSLEPQHLPVTIKGKRYVLHEPSEADKVAFNTKNLRGARIEGDRVVQSMEHAAESPSHLVSLCLRDVSKVPEHAPFTGDGKRAGVPVTLEFVKSLGGRQVKVLNEKALDMGGMTDNQAQLEKAFPLMCEKVFKLAKDAGEKAQWGDWMRGEIDRAAGVRVEGTPEDQAKN